MSYLRNHKLLLLIIGVLLVANLGLLYFFVFDKHQYPGRMSPEDMRKKSIEKAKTEVGLNDEQAARYDSLRTKQFENMRPLFDDLVKAKEDYFSLIYQQGVSDSVLNSYATRIGEKQMAIDVNTFRYFRTIKDLCTEEQKPKMDSFIKQIVKRIINSNGPRRSSPDKKSNK
jgi:hypothetical protein